MWKKAVVALFVLPRHFPGLTEDNHETYG